MVTMKLLFISAIFTLISLNGHAADYATGVNINGGLAQIRSVLPGSGTNRVHIICVGDSIAEGYAVSPSTDSNRWEHGWVGQLRSSIQSQYRGTGWGIIPAFRQSSDYSYANLDYSSGWTAGAFSGYSGGPFGAGMSGSGSGTTVTLTNVTCAAFEIFYTLTASSGDAFTIGINGDDTRTQTQIPKSPEVSTSVLVVTNLLSGTIIVKCPGASKTLSLNGIGVYGATNGVYVDNIGKAGTVVSLYAIGANWSTNSNASLMIFALDTNDTSNQTDTNSYASSITNILRYSTNSESVLIINSNFRQGTYTIPQTAYFQVERNLAPTFNAAVWSAYDLWGPSNGVYSVDGIHPDNLGHSAMGTNIIFLLGQTFPIQSTSIQSLTIQNATFR